MKKRTLTPNSTPSTEVKTHNRKQVITPPISITHEGDSMRGLFFIIKGQHSKAEPSFMNRETGEVNYIGGYDPYSKDTVEWYMVMDKITFHCFSCGSDLNKVLKAVHTIIYKYKGSAKKYFKHISDISSDDYYETHYLGRTPLNHDQRVKKAEGRCPRVSPAMREMYKSIYSEYGDFYKEQIEEMEDLAYSDLEEWKKANNPLNKTKKRMEKTKIKKTVVMEEKTPKKEVGVAVPKKLAKPIMKKGIKKIPR